MATELTITCRRCYKGTPTTIVLKGEPKSVSMCHCGECRIRCCGVGGAYATYNKDQVEVKNLNSAWTNAGTHVMCKCYVVIFLHAKDYSTDDELNVNAGMICNAIVGGDTPMEKISKDNDPFFYGDFFNKDTLNHVNYENRIFDWKEDWKESSEDSKPKKPLPEAAVKALEAKEVPAVCFCGKAKAVVKGDCLASTICLCSLCRSRSTTFDSSVEFPADSVEFTTPDEMEFQKWDKEEAHSTVSNCKICGTVFDNVLDDMAVSVFNTNSIVKGLIGDDNPADYDWGERTNPRLHAPSSLINDLHYMFYKNRSVNLYDDSPKWVDIPAPFGGTNVLLDPKGNPIPSHEKEENEE